jgi:hypothetical protein
MQDLDPVNLAGLFFGSSRTTGKHRTLIESISVAAVTADLGFVFTAATWKNGAPPGAR